MRRNMLFRGPTACLCGRAVSGSPLACLRTPQLPEGFPWFYCTQWGPMSPRQLFTGIGRSDTLGFDDQHQPAARDRQAALGTVLCPLQECKFCASQHRRPILVISVLCCFPCVVPRHPGADVGWFPVGGGGTVRSRSGSSSAANIFLRSFQVPAGGIASRLRSV